ncbi:hypothetical protein QVD17_12333 [Tagetes erecta]|uniref:Uncharacterized protein n=1 Tax=Tagetes erecta TaxID=13708 RepID=A0AAD8L0Z7_TARER|nr:hypothetical protein QVD17_12333 [Tagetes erecta]
MQNLPTKLSETRGLELSATFLAAPGVQPIILFRRRFIFPPILTKEAIEPLPATKEVARSRLRSDVTLWGLWLLFQCTLLWSWIKDILSSRSVCLMPSIESIGAISSLGGRAIDSSCPWLVKGMR